MHSIEELVREIYALGRVNRELVDLEAPSADDLKLLHGVVTRHRELTGSAVWTYSSTTILRIAARRSVTIFRAVTTPMPGTRSNAS